MSMFNCLSQMWWDMLLEMELEKESEMGFNTESEMWFKKELDTKNGKHYKKY